MKKSSKRLTAGGLAGGMVLCAGVVWAHTYPGTMDGLGADNREHWGCFVPVGNIPIALWDHLEYFEVTAPGTTAGHGNFTLRWEAPCTSHTDAAFDDRFAVTGVLGRRTCATFSQNGTVCDRNNIFLNNAAVAARASEVSITTYQQARKTWGHEMGHSVGLGHWVSAVTDGAQDSMTSGAANFVGWDVYSAHNWAHLRNDF